MNRYEEDILKGLKNLNDADLLTNVDIERGIEKLLKPYNHYINKLEQKIKSKLLKQKDITDGIIFEYKSACCSCGENRYGKFTCLVCKGIEQLKQKPPKQ